jgi:putative acetyltransferase
MTCIIRTEMPEDIGAVHQLNAAAFKSEAEPQLVDQLRARGAGLLSLVAEMDGQVVGHIFFSPMEITGEDGRVTPAVGLAPLAVLPGFQNQGIGSQLARAGLDELRRMGHRLVIVLGHANYYPRFGFKPTLPYGIGWDHEVDEAHFMIMELQPGALAGVHGVARYQPEFEGV